MKMPTDLFAAGCRIGEVIPVKLATGRQFTYKVSHCVRLQVDDAGVATKYEKITDEIARVFKFKPLRLLEAITPGLKCIVYYGSIYERGVVKAIIANCIAKVVLLDTATIVVVHFSCLYATTGLWSRSEPRVIICKLKGLSVFSSGFYLRYILQTQIDWDGKLNVTVTKTGAIPTVLCHCDTYPNTTINQVVLNYLCAAYDPRRLIRLHSYWPNSLVTANHLNGRVSVQLDTPLRGHVQKLLGLAKAASNRIIPYRPNTLLPFGVVCLGIFHHDDTFERCTLTAVPVSDPAEKFRIAVKFIDTGDTLTYDRNYPFRIILNFQHYPAIINIPPLCAEIYLNGLKGTPIPTEFLKNVMRKQIQVSVEIVGRPEGEVPVADILEFLPRRLFNYNLAIAQCLLPNFTDTQEPFVFRQFSSLYNFAMPFHGQNWGRGADSQRIFDLTAGTRFYGKVTRIGDPGYFVVQPLDPLPLPRVRRGVRVLEFSCGCLWDGQFFRIKEDDGDHRNVRVRLANGITLPEPYPHFMNDVGNVRVHAFGVDTTGLSTDVSVLHLRKMMPHTARVPPEVAHITLDGSPDAFVWWDKFQGTILGKTLVMELIHRGVDEIRGRLNLTVRIIEEDHDATEILRKSSVGELEY